MYIVYILVCIYTNPENPPKMCIFSGMVSKICTFSEKAKKIWASSENAAKM